jgi:hypothetical protein
MVPALTPLGFVLDAKPPAQPHSGVVVDRPVRFIVIWGALRRKLGAI